MRDRPHRPAHGTLPIRVVVIMVLLLGLLPTRAHAQASDGVGVTFSADVASILRENCEACHRPGAIGPMSLTDYEEVRPWAPMIRDQVSRREMPPYHYDTDLGIQRLKEDRRLSADEIDTIVSWVDAGAPRGDPSELPPPVEWPSPGEWRLASRFGQPDLVVPSTPYDLPAAGQDIYHRPIVPTGLTEDRCIRAIETKPSVPGRAFTHHANSSLVVETSGGNLRPVGFLSEYALGKLGEIVPEDACRTLPANSFVSWDIHYYPSGTAVSGDRVEVGVWFHDDREARRDSAYRQNLTLYFLEGGDYDIPPHGKLTTQGFHSFDHPVRIDSWQPHGHLRMTGMALEIFYPQTGEREMISMVSNWHPGWHLSHIYEEDVAPLVPAGAVLVLTAWYDNTADNPHNPDPDQWVGIGQRTADEMSHAWMAVTHLDEEAFERLAAEREARQREAAQ